MIEEHIKAVESIDLNEVMKVVTVITKALDKGNKLLIIGNGGSAADAQHFAGELMGKFKKEREALPAIALTTNSSILTAIANDYSFDDIFVRQLEGLAENDDILFTISTSGNSKNIIEALKWVSEKNIITIGLSGKDGGDMKNYCDYLIKVDSYNTPRIQEAHILIIHMICELVENALFWEH